MKLNMFNFFFFMVGFFCLDVGASYERATKAGNMLVGAEGNDSKVKLDSKLSALVPLRGGNVIPFGLMKVGPTPYWLV